MNRYRYRVFKDGRLLAIVDGVKNNTEAILTIDTLALASRRTRRRYTAVLA
jgi:hypothetical protein